MLMTEPAFWCCGRLKQLIKGKYGSVIPISFQLGERLMLSLSSNWYVASCLNCFESIMLQDSRNNLAPL